METSASTKVLDYRGGSETVVDIGSAADVDTDVKRKQRKSRLTAFTATNLRAKTRQHVSQG